MEFDWYARAYAICLAATFFVSLLARSPARTQGSCLLVAGWVGAIAIQQWSGQYTSPVVSALIAFTMSVMFAVMGLLYNRTWAWIVSGFHIGMLFTHLAFELTPGASVFVYLSVLSAFGYASMITITGRPLVRLLGGGGGSTSYHGFMRGGRLDSSAFKAKRKAR